MHSQAEREEDSPAEDSPAGEGSPAAEDSLAEEDNPPVGTPAAAEEDIPT